MPNFAHVSLILAPDRSKLSKRHGATSVGQVKFIHHFQITYFLKFYEVSLASFFLRLTLGLNTFLVPIKFTNFQNWSLHKLSNFSPYKVKNTFFVVKSY